MVSLRTTRLNIKKFCMMLALRRVYFVRISEQTASFAVHDINLLVPEFYI